MRSFSQGAKRGHHKDEPSNSAEEHGNILTSLHTTNSSAMFFDHEQMTAFVIVAEVPSDAELNERLDRRYCACDQVFCIRFILLIFFGQVSQKKSHGCIWS